MKHHPDKGAHIMGAVKQLADIVPGMRFHHEKVDGTGYPLGLKGDENPACGPDHLGLRHVRRHDDRPAVPEGMDPDFVVGKLRSWIGSRFREDVVEASRRPSGAGGSSSGRAAGARAAAPCRRSSSLFVNLGYTRLASSGRARAGLFRTSHGEVRTPVFMPVGRRARSRAAAPRSGRDSGPTSCSATRITSCSGPDPRWSRSLGGLHRFMGWDRLDPDRLGRVPGLLARRALRKIEEDGRHVPVAPRRPSGASRRGRDGRCRTRSGPTSPCSSTSARPVRRRGDEVEAVERRCAGSAGEARPHRRRADQALFGIVQGGTHPELRAPRAPTSWSRCAFDGLALGGLAASGRAARCETARAWRRGAARRIGRAT